MRYYGCIVRRPPQEPTFSGKPSNLQQFYELASSQIKKLEPKMRNIPVCTEHGRVKVGKVNRTWQKPDGSWYVDFELDQNELGTDVNKLVNSGALKGLSLMHDASDWTPLEVSLVWSGARPETGVEGHVVVPVHDSNSDEYIADSRDSAVTTEPYNPPVLIAASSQASIPFSLMDSTTATSTPAPAAAVAAPVTTPVAAESTSISTPAPVADAAAPAGAEENSADQYEIIEKLVMKNDAIRESDKAKLVKLYVNSLKATQAKEIAAKEQENKLRKLQQEILQTKQEKANQREVAADLFDKMMKQYAPEFAQPEMSEKRKQLLASHPDQYIDSILPAMVAASGAIEAQRKLNEQLTIQNKQDQELREQMNALRALTQGAGQAPAGSELVAASQFGTKRSFEATVPSSKAPANNAGWMSKSMSAETAALFNKYAHDIDAERVAFNQISTSVKRQAVEA